MAEQTLPDNSLPELVPVWQSPLRQFFLLTLGIGCILFALFTLTDYFLRQAEARGRALQSVGGARAVLTDERGQAALWADILSQRLKGMNRKEAQAALLASSSLWPAARFSLYDDLGPILTVKEGAELETAGAAVFAGKGESLVGRALQGASSSGESLIEGFVAVSGAAPVRSASVRAVLVSVLFDPGYLMRVKNRVGADVLVLGLNEFASSGVRSTVEEEDGMPGQAVALPFFKGQILPYKGLCASVRTSGVSREAGIIPLGPDAAAPAALLMTFPLRAPFSLSGRLAALAFAGGCLAALPLFLWRRRYASQVFSAVAESLGRFTEEGFEPPANWPEPLLRLSRSLTRRQAAQRAAMEKAAQEREEVLLQLEDQNKVLPEDDYRVFFEASSRGMFQMAPDGRLLHVNRSVASMLGYESPSHLMSERGLLGEFCLHSEDSLTLLHVLREHPQKKHVITLRQRNGKARNFTIMSLHGTAENTGDRTVINGFLISRRLEELVELLRVSWEEAKSDKASLAMLLAAVSHQSQLYLTAQLQAGGTDVDSERSVAALRSLFADLYQIALTETEETEPVAVPMDVFDVMRQACDQADFVLKARGVTLHCDTSADLISTVSGVAPVLRHALLRALFTVIMSASGGRAYLSVVPDPNAPRLPDVSRLLFSASWKAGIESAHASQSAVAEESRTPESVPAFISEFDDTPSSWYAAETGPDNLAGTVAINLAEERAILHFLVQKMHGELLHGFYTRDSRSVQFIVQLEHLPEHFVDITVRMQEEAAFGAASAEGATPTHAEQVGRPAVEAGISILSGPGAGAASFLNVKEAVLPGSDDLALQVLVMDDESVALGRAAGPDDGLDILLVDDSQDNRLLVSLFLRETRHRITEAHTGQEGVEAFLRKKFDIIFMDMEMPLMDGYQATRIIRALEADVGAVPTPIVAQTAHVLPEFRHRYLLAGCTEILAKPFSKNALLTLLDAFIKMRREGASGKSE